RGTGAHRILPRAVRGPVRRRDGFPGERKAPTESPVRHLPPKLVVAPARGAVADVLEPRTKPFDQVPIPDVRRVSLADAGCGHIEDPLGPRRPRPTCGFRDERARIGFEVEPVLSLPFVDLRRVAEEAAVMEDLIEVADERAAISKVQQFLLEFFDERLHLGDPLVSMTADAEQLAFRREAEAFLDEEELVGSAGAAKDELVHAVPGGVDQSRGGAVDQVAGGEQVPAPRRERLAIEDPQDRAENVVAPHVRRTVERIEDDGEAPAAELLHLAHLLRGHLGDEVRLAACVHEQVVHPDVEFELLLPVHIAALGRIPPDREAPPWHATSTSPRNTVKSAPALSTTQGTFVARLRRSQFFRSSSGLVVTFGSPGNSAFSTSIPRGLRASAVRMTVSALWWANASSLSSTGYDIGSHTNGR